MGICSKRFSVAIGAALLALSTASAQLPHVEDQKQFDPPITFPDHSFRYGPHRSERIDFYRASSGVRGAAPIVLYFSQAGGMRQGGENLRWAIYSLTRQGFAVATPRFERSDALPLAGLLRNLCKGVAELRSNGRHHEFDPDKILLLGQGFGGQAAMLFGTDPSYLQACGVPFEAVRAVAVVNAVGFDITGEMAKRGRYVSDRYRKVFGKDATTHSRISPIAHLPPPNVQRVLLFASENKRAEVEQARGMADALGRNGVDARFELLRPWRQDWSPSYFLAEPKQAGWSLIEFFKNSALAGP